MSRCSGAARSRDERAVSLGAAVRNRVVAGSFEEVIAVPLDSGEMLAFTPGARGPLPLLTIITAPLMNFARAAEALRPDEGPDRPFEEHGPKEIRALARAVNAPA